MKKLFLLLFISFSSLAQTQKGSFSVGTGSLNFTSDLIYQVNTISITPTTGYMVMPNLEVGLGLFLQYYKHSKGNRFYRGFETTLMPYITQYFGRKRFQPFISAGGGLNFHNYKDNNVDNNKSFTPGWNASVGGKYFITNNIDLGLDIGVRNTKGNHEEGNSRKIHTIYSGGNFTLYFPSKKKENK